MPHKGQLPIIAAFFIHLLTGVFVQCGRKFGKTELGIYIMYLFAILFPNSEIYYIVDEKDHARDICWNNGRLPYFFTQLSQLKGEKHEAFVKRKKIGRVLYDKYIDKINNAEMTVKFKNGSIISVDGAKNYTKADGLSPHLVVYDEFKDHNSEYDQRMRPNLKTHKGRILVIGTPSGDEDDNYHKTAEEFRTKKGHVFFKRPCWMNPHVYEGEDDPELEEDKSAYERRGELHVFMREYLAEIVPDYAKLIFPMWSDDFILPFDRMLEEVRYTYKDWDYLYGFDPASTSTFGGLSVCINKYDKRVFLMDEIYEQDMRKTTGKLIYPRAKVQMKEVYPDMNEWYQLYDFAAAWFAIEVANEFNVGIHPCTKDMKTKENKLSIIKDSMLSRFFVSDRCVNFRKEARGYKKEDNGTIKKINDHLLDILRYIYNANNYASVAHEKIKPFTNKRFYTFEDERELKSETDKYALLFEEV